MVPGPRITEVTWTFDPLISRNAYFNLSKLAAAAPEYLPDFYGPRSDEHNVGATDRLLIRWDLATERVALACAGVPHRVDGEDATGDVVVGLDAGPDGRPVVGRFDGDVVLVRVPHDIAALRRSDPESAHAWRLAVREVLGGLMARGRVVRGFSRRGWYVLDRGTESL